ncbi:MAG: phosphoribosylformylglycinamidine cyclo-ligase [Elusimicrobia bacterium]|nr:phosphoribosylformylglycinamidine cyclo-ligase [Elusimicrobiota bacterium]
MKRQHPRRPADRPAPRRALTYKTSGVDIELADKLVDHLRRRSKAIGGFAGLFPLEPDGGAPHCLVACTDGVGTKLKVAFALDRHETVGIDLVAMCVNDLITCGARPLFFLDYYATGKLDLARSKRIMAGIIEGCRLGRSVLLGGETAEMPGFYPKGEYDLAGFSVGIVKRSEVIDGTKIFPGDLILGLPSSGLHSNGYSLVRKVFSDRRIRKLGRELIAPTRIYVPQIAKLQEGFRAAGHIILGLAHITGGGIVENLPRVLPRRTQAVLHQHAWQVPPIMLAIQREGGVPAAEMWRTFNMGIGMIIVIRPNALETARALLPEAKLIGEVTAGRREVRIE